jgi:hypothetical protein
MRIAGREYRRLDGKRRRELIDSLLEVRLDLRDRRAQARCDKQLQKYNCQEFYTSMG